MAKRLCAEAEETITSWGYKEILLLVEEQNIPANKLYEKLGDTERICDPNGVALRVVSGQLTEQPTPTRVLTKQL